MATSISGDYPPEPLPRDDGLPSPLELPGVQDAQELNSTLEPTTVGTIHIATSTADRQTPSNDETEYIKSESYISLIISVVAGFITGVFDFVNFLVALPLVVLFTILVTLAFLVALVLSIFLSIIDTFLSIVYPNANNGEGYFRHSSWRPAFMRDGVDDEIAEQWVRFEPAKRRRGGRGVAEGESTSERNGVMKEDDEITPMTATDDVEGVIDLESGTMNGDGEHDAEDLDCSICLQKYEEGDVAVELPCGHYYHEKCVIAWTMNSVRCPLCNFNLRSNEHEQFEVEMTQNTNYDDI